MGFDGFPMVVGWELTLACNLRCGHCGSSAGLCRERELDTAEAIAICDQLPALLVQEVDFTGGEPLLREDWPVLVSHLRGLGITTRLVTNGLLLDREMVKRLLGAGLSTIGVSLDGLEGTNDRIRRRPGLFRHLLSALAAAVDEGLPVTVITAVNSANLPELPKVFEVLRDLGVRQWQVQPTIPFGRVLEPGGLRLDEEAFVELGRFVREWRPAACTGGLELRPADGVGYYTTLDTQQPPWRGCSAGMVACGITSDGRVKGCLSWPDDLAEGDLRQRDLWDIWFAPDAFAYNRQFETADLGPYCTGCEHGADCGGGCLALSYAITGQFHNDPLCFTRLLGP